MSEGRQKVCNVTICIHTFSDNSKKAYAAVTYARQDYEDGTERIHLVAANSR